MRTRPPYLQTAASGLIGYFRRSYSWSAGQPYRFNDWGAPVVHGTVAPIRGIQPAADGSYWANHFKFSSSAYLGYGTPAIAAPKAITFCAWIYLDTLPGAGGYYCLGFTNQIKFYVKDTVQLALYLVSPFYDPGTLTITSGRWYHLAVSYSNANGSTGYVDAAVDSTTVGGSDLGSINFCGIGSDGIGNFFDGIIDDFRVYNRVLSKAEIKSIRA